MKRILQVISVVIVLAGLNACTVSRLELYGDRLVYAKSDSSLFSGTLKMSGNASHGEEQFCDGIPCGEWSEHGRDGDFIMGGEYLDVNAVLSDESKSLVRRDTLSITHWREGDVPYVTVTILKPDIFFHANNEDKQGSIAKDLAASVGTDLTNKGYEYHSLTIHFVDGFLDATKFVNKRYHVQWREAQEVE